MPHKTVFMRSGSLLRKTQALLSSDSGYIIASS